MEDVVDVVDSAEEAEPKPHGSPNGLKPGEVRVTPNGNKVVVETTRWVATLAVRRFADGSLLVGDRLFPPPVDGSSSQWGRTGQGGGGGGGKSGGGGGNQEASAGSWRPPYTAVGTPPELRDYRLPDEVRRRLDFTFSRAIAAPLASEKKLKKKGGGVASSDGNSTESREKRGSRPKPKQRRGRTED